MKETKFTQGERVQSVKMGHCFGMPGRIVTPLLRMPGTKRRYVVQLDRPNLRLVLRENWLERVSTND